MNLTELGKIYSSGDAFTTKAALLQSAYRWLGKFPIGKTSVKVFTGQIANGKKVYKTELKEYGHIVDKGEEINRNFFFESTWKYAHKRVDEKKSDETIKADRLFNNLLSSMPLAFNLFHPLMELLKTNESAATKIISALFPDYDVCKVNEINIEFIPLPITSYTNDKSAMDAVIFFTDSKGFKNIIAIEVKYTDTLGSNKARENDLKYRAATDTNYFTQEGLQHIEGGCTQVYRNFLLTEKYRMVHHLANSYNVILAPKENPSTQNEINSLKDYIDFNTCPTNKITKYNLEDFVLVITNNIPANLNNWIVWFQERYLDFNKIEPLFIELKQK